MSSKRKPFGEAPRDISNRASSADPNPTKNAMTSRGRSRNSRCPPLSIRTKSANHASVAGTQNATANGAADAAATNDTKARRYKALSYSDRITIASQTQRIEALHAELEEVKMFASIEKSADSIMNAGASQEAAPTNDGELFEALVQELESTEADLKASQSRVSQLEIELQSAKSAGTASTQASVGVDLAAGEKAELNKIIEKQRKELEKSQSDAKEGVAIMREIEKALRVARKDRDASKAAMEEALSSAEVYKKQIEEMESERKQQCGLKEEHSALKTRYANLEKSMTEMQKVLEVVQSRSEKKVTEMKDAIIEAQVREEKSAVEYEALNKKYNAVQSQCTETKEVLADMTSKFQLVKNKVDTKEKELDTAKVRYDAGVEALKQHHEKEIERQIKVARKEVRKEDRVLYDAMLAEKESEHQAAMKEMQLQHEYKLKASINEIQVQHERQLKEKSDLLNACEKQVQELRAKSQKMEIATGEIENNQWKIENERLKSENAELVRKIERGVVMYNEATSQLRAKTAEVKAASNKGSNADIVAANKAMKKELTKSVESSISRGKQIQALEKEIESYRLKLSKANQIIQSFEESVPSVRDENKFQKLEAQITSLTSSAEEARRDRQKLESKIESLDTQAKNTIREKELLESQVNSFKSQAQEAKKKMSNMTEEICVLSAKASQLEILERDLTNARLALANSQSRIFRLEEALQDTETALRVSSSRLTSANNPGQPAVDCCESEIRKHVEDDALKEYIRQRL